MKKCLCDYVCKASLLPASAAAVSSLFDLCMFSSDVRPTGSRRIHHNQVAQCRHYLRKPSGHMRAHKPCWGRAHVVTLRRLREVTGERSLHEPRVAQKLLQDRHFPISPPASSTGNSGMLAANVLALPGCWFSILGRTGPYIRGEASGYKEGGCG